MVVWCANGNMYAFKLDGPNNKYHPELGSTRLDPLATDGARRVMHYYENTMSKLGVSRLQVEDDAEIPASGVITAWVPYDAKEDKLGDDYMYLAVDLNMKIFHRMVYEYDDGLAELFLAEDPIKGAATLESRDIQYTVTGGKVKTCTALWLLQATYEDVDDYTGYGNSTDVGLEDHHEDSVRRSRLDCGDKAKAD
ncbi:Fc.00g083590.m01.CDS01 [Cosmosporella sp. VM-42]